MSDAAHTPTDPARAFALELSELAGTDRLLVALDFDGTLSPFVDDPGEARVLPAAAQAIVRLEAQPDTWVAYVSGRPLDSLARVTQADDAALLIGSHGVEVRLDGGRVDLGLDAGEQDRLRQLGDALQAVIDATEGAVLEHKPVGYGVHTRLVEPDLVPGAHAAAREAAQRIGGFTERDGKDILEFAARDATKGDGVDRLREHLGATGVLYAGDDVTDEDGFAVMRDGDIGVKVGEGATSARFRVADPDAVAALLSLLASGREQWAASRHRG
jgi:trehalose-phosphatase